MNARLSRAQRALIIGSIAVLLAASQALCARAAVDPNVDPDYVASPVPLASGTSPQALPAQPAGALPSPALSASPGTDAVPGASAVPAAVPTPTLAPTPIPTPTPPPLTIDQSLAQIIVGYSLRVHAAGAIGPLTFASNDTQIADVSFDPTSGSLLIVGKNPGTAFVTIGDARGPSLRLPVHVAYLAGTIAPQATIRITGNPATSVFVGEEAAHSASRESIVRPGAVAFAPPNGLDVHDLDIDNAAVVNVPVTISGPGYFPVNGITKVYVQNFAQPHIRPTSLVVSDFPERLHEDGLLFSTTLHAEDPMRMLFYHYNPPGQPDRRIILRAQNPGDRPVLLHCISGYGGPNANEMAVGHLSTQRFLVRESQNEGTVLELGAHSTRDLIVASLPAGAVVSDLVQLREIDGPPIPLVLFAERSDTPATPAMLSLDAPLLSDGVKHARGVYPIPEFYLETTYNTDASPLEISIGRLPLPNLRQGEALAGDYGVAEQIDATLVNSTSFPASVALYANPRGGRATGTFLIDRVLVQSHALAPFSHVKLRQYVVPAHGFVRVQVVTMPEGGSFYPLNLVLAPDDGSVAPDSPGSPVY